MKLRHLILLIAACMALAPCMAQTTRCQTIAHRGEWRSEGSAQNSRTSLQRAMDLNIFGSEIDIWLTRDDHIMVNHDAKYQGISLQDTTFAACKKLRLSNGERMPELKHLLKILKKSKSPTRLIVEVKPHRDPMRSRRCAAMAVNEIRRRGLEDRVMYISFSIEACLTIHAMAPEADVAYLEGDRTPASLHHMGINGIDYHFSKFQAHPEWVGEAHRLGMNVNVWTVDKPEDIRAMKALGVDYITTNEPARCEELIR
jgi:glycerophosphoryl diester phosphodiesterase